MNELFSPLRALRRIELATEPPFRLGALTVRPAALEVEREDGVETLEPRVMQVLVALHRARGEPVSREELSNLCWDGRIVGVDALNRCIGRLRKALAPEPCAAIDTIPKIGYRLRSGSASAPVRDDTTRPRPEAAPRSGPRWRIAAGVAALALLGGGATAFYAVRTPDGWSAEGVRPLTAEIGVETHPALSPDGRFLIYAAGGGYLQPRDLFMRAVGDGAPLRLTAHAADEFAPSWAPDGQRIAFVRQTGLDPCAIVVMPVPRGAERVVARCRVDTGTRLAWTPAGELVFSDRGSAGEARRLRAVNVESGAVRDLTRPAPETIGDFDPVVSRDGRRLAFRRNISAGVDDLYWLDLRTGAERPITQDGWKSHGSAFGADGRTLFFTSNRGGDFGLWAVDMRGQPRPPQRVSLGLLSFGRISADQQGRLAVETSGFRQNLFRVAEGGPPEALTASSASDWDPEVGPDGALAYVSDQGGGPELWLRPPGGEPARLTRLGASYVASPRWSPDGREIVFLAARDHETDLYRIGADGAGLRRLTRGGGAKADPAWTAGGLVYAARGPAGWGLLRLRADGRTEAVRGGEGFTALRTARGALYGLKAGDPRLWTLPAAGGAPQPAMAALALEADPIWSVDARGVYQVRGRASGRASLWLTDWSGAERKVADLPQAAYKPTITVDARDGAVVFGKVVQDETDIALLELLKS